MILRENSTEKKLQGAYYTPQQLAQKMIDFFSTDKTVRKILEPSCGDGVFIDSILQSKHLSKQQISAVEINNNEARKVKKKFINHKNIEIINDDFLSYYDKNKDCRFDLIVGNPPYIRYQYLNKKQREKMSSILSSHGMKENKLINIWVAFMVACVSMLSDNGKILFIIPAEIMQVAYAKDLRLFLTEHLSKITLLTFKKLVFPDIEQEIVVFIGEKSNKKKGIKIVELENLSDLEKLNLSEISFQKCEKTYEKWTKYFTTKKEMRFLERIKADNRFKKISEYALINVGVTTGNNSYFSVNREKVIEYDLKNVVRPLIGRSAHASSVFFNKNDWEENINRGKAAFLIDFPEIPFDKYTKKQKKYIIEGEKKGQNIGYKCRIRDRWYRIPSIWVPDAFFLRRNNLYPKFVLNNCNAVSTDTMHRIKFNKNVNPEKIVLAYYCSIAFAFTEICGRSYGGGVLEILPGEVGDIYIPSLDIVPDLVVHKVLCEVDNIVRNKKDIEEALDLVDKKVLKEYLDITIEDSLTARKIWKKMQTRRLGRGSI